YDISASGDTIYYLENDIYLSNSNHELMTLELSDSIDLQLVDFSANEFKLKKVSLSDFIEYLKNDPIILVTLKNGLVIAMTETYIP
ncbi:MAG: hypothetical protein JKZ00_05225, partial [Flavobacteriaceae bacterium]|nr:hypothetical protein [Flavobacteriaceae bacterium]